MHSTLYSTLILPHKSLMAVVTDLITAVVEQLMNELVVSARDSGTMRGSRSRDSETSEVCGICEVRTSRTEGIS
jgi:hypothetical protein